jgi:hypothetical protein
MTLFYIDPNDPAQQFPNPPKGLSQDEIEHQKILDNWFAFTDTLEPEFSKLTFFPENILPHNREVYLEVFKKEFANHKKLDTLTPEILNSIAINVGNLFRFSKLIDKSIHKIYAQKIMDYPESVKMFDKKSLLDTYLQRSLTENIFHFCEQEGFPKEIMYVSNFLFLSTPDESYNTFYKNKFLSQGSNIKKSAFKNSSNEKNIDEDDFYKPEGAIKKYFEKNPWSYYIVGLIMFVLMCYGVIVQIPK